MASRKRSISNDADVSAPYKEWDEASCPICIDHPHNAVLLICSAHDKGCRPYICDTSYRHSNCLDRFKKLKEENQSDSVNTLDFGETSDEKSEEWSNLICPLCRGSVLGWKVPEEARKYLNSKSRSCSRESCSFTGDYGELRRHARRVHPTVHPAHVDPSRQRAWARLEARREYDDIVSAVSSAIPGATVVGDYVIERGDENRLSTLFLFHHMVRSMNSGNDVRGGRFRSRVLQRYRRGTGNSSRPRYLLGENPLVARSDDDESENVEIDLNVANEHGDDGDPNPRRRRRLTRARYGEDQH